MWFPTMWLFDKADSDEPVQPPFKLRNSKWCSVSSLTVIEYSSDEQRLWSDCAYAQADLSLCWSHIPYCLKSHVAAHYIWSMKYSRLDWLWAGHKPRREGFSLRSPYTVEGQFSPVVAYINFSPYSYNYFRFPHCTVNILASGSVSNSHI